MYFPDPSPLAATSRSALLGTDAETFFLAKSSAKQFSFLVQHHGLYSQGMAA